MKVRLSETMDAYMLRRKNSGITEGVRRNEQSTLTRLLKQCGGNLYMDSIRDSHVDDTIAELGKTNTPRSLANHFFTLKGFFQWCVDSGRISRHPMAGMKPPEFTVRERNRLEVSKFPALLDAALFPRDRFLMAMGLYTLSRTVEILNVKIGDVKHDLRRIRMDVAKVRGRNRIGTDLKPITIELQDELDRWLIEYSRMFGRLEDDWYLIPTRTQGQPVRVARNGDPLAPGARMVNWNYVPTRKIGKTSPKNIVQEALEAVHFPTRADDGTALGEGMHTLRRSGARARYDAKRWMGHDNAIRHVQMLLNHANAGMTETYIGINLDKIERDEELIDDYMYPQNRTDGKVVDFATQKAMRRLAEADGGAMPYFSKQLGRALSADEQDAFETFIQQMVGARAVGA